MSGLQIRNDYHAEVGNDLETTTLLIGDKPSGKRWWIDYNEWKALSGNIKNKSELQWLVDKILDTSLISKK